MKKIRFLLLFSLVLLGSAHAQQAEPSAVLSPATAEFSCTQSRSGKCHYLVVASVCNEELSGAQKQKSCKYAAVNAFVIRVGEKKELAGLPAGFLYCMKSDAPPTVDFCMKFPVTH
ncbi:hypothetical protein [Undibacterium sp.]|uniref:hypothetical protein n=1 Tax=Undibacterium sp. TaxID=1914977 RepID=UPI00374D81E1